MQTFNTVSIQAPSEGEEYDRCAGLLSHSAYTERLILPLVEEETPLPSREGANRYTDRKEIAQAYFRKVG
jgi:hypothetical protein